MQQDKITWLLEFSDRGMERDYRYFACTRTYLATDFMVVAVNIFASAASLLRLRIRSDLTLWSKFIMSANLMLSIIHAVIIRQMPAFYARWRTYFIGLARILRVLLILAISFHLDWKPHGWASLLLKFFLLSPASGNFIFAIGLPLPMRSHLAVQLMVVGLGLYHVQSFCSEVLPPSDSFSCQIYSLMMKAYEAVNVFDLRVLVHAGEVRGHCCLSVLSSVVVSSGLILSTVFLYLVELSSRLKYLSSLRQVDAGLVENSKRTLKMVCFVYCSAYLFLLPVVWEVCVMLQALQDQGMLTFGYLRLLVVITALVIEMFMKVWLTALMFLVSSVALAIFSR
jgi:hypothetical protein